MWGEISDKQSEENINQVIDLTPIIEQCRQKDCLAMYQIATCTNEQREIILPPMDSRLLYAAELHQYIGHMTDVIEDAELAVEYNLVMPCEMPPAVLPEPPIVKRNVTLRKPIHFLDKEYSNFSKGYGENAPIIGDTTRKHIQKQCIATILAHIGFMNSNTTVLDVLNDVFEDFIKHICGDMRSLTDSLLTGSTSSFSDTVEQVLVQNGLGGVRGLSEYYERKINKYEEIMKERCENVVTRYEMLSAPVNMQVECKSDRMEDMENENIPEVHFSAMDGEEGYLQPFLESGFQMLDSLEEGSYVP